MGSATGGPNHQDCFVLKWNDFPTNVVTNLQEMRDENDFYDVTLACDEQSFIQGHKVILSASSPYFKAILRRSPINQHPVLLMPPGIRFCDLIQLLDFIYNGEINLASEDLNSFMALAEHLQIRGLTEDNKLKQQQFQQQHQKLPQKQLPKIPAAIKMVKPKGSSKPMNPTPGMGQKRRRVEAHFHDEDVDEVGHHVDFEDFPEFDDQHGFVEEDHGVAAQPQAIPSTSGGIQLTGLICPQCRMVYHEVEALKDHIARAHRVQQHETQPQEPSATCDICDKSFKSMKYVIAHQKRVHKLFATNPESKRGRPKKAEYYPEEEKVGDEDESEYYDPPPMTSSHNSGLRQPQQHPHSEPRPVGQVHPAPRPLQKVGRGPVASPQIRHQSEDTLSRPGPSPQRRPPVGHPQQSSRPQFSGEMFQTEGPPKRLPQHQQGSGRLHVSASQPGPSGGMDIRRLGKQLGGQISITSSDLMASPGPNRRPLPVPTETPPKFKGESSSRNPQISRSIHPNIANAASAAAIEVKEEPEDFLEEEFEEEDFVDDDEGEMDDSGEYLEDDGEM